jgi:ubiquitin-protein ligase
MSEIDKFRDEKYKGRDARLFKEWDLLEKKFGKDSRVTTIIVRKQNAKSKLPEKYEIIFNVKSIVGVNPMDENKLETPIFGNRHRLTVDLPDNYPSAEGLPRIMFASDVWHPNIRFFGDFKGRVCLTFQDRPLTTPLTDYIDTVLEYLTYEDYMANDAYPYPEDLTVAAWVREQAEPNKWLNFTQN